MTATTIDLRGAELSIIVPAGQPLEVLFDFVIAAVPVDVSGFEWLGQIRSDPVSPEPLASFAFTNPTAVELLATVEAAALEALAGVGLVYEIEQLAPTHRQMFYGTVVVDQDAAR